MQAVRFERAGAGSVLLVDDELFQVAALAAILRDIGLTAEYATTGAEALRQISARKPDLLVVDSKMPDMTAAELIRQARDRHGDLLVVLLSGYPSDSPALAEAMAATQGSYLAKPVDLMRLVALVGHAAAQRSSP